MKTTRALLVILLPLYLFAVNASAYTASQVGFIDASIAPYGATGNGTTNDWNAIQSALEAAKTSETAVFLPPGDYLIGQPLTVHHMSGLVGSKKDPARRTRIILAPNASGYNDPAIPKAVVANGFEGKGGADTWYVLIQHFDVVIGKGNAGAVGVTTNAAENCHLVDVNVDLTQSGYIGFMGGFASGGLNHNLSAKGGSYGFYFENERPSPTLVGCTFEGQTVSALFNTVRGSHVFVGCTFRMPKGTMVHKGICGNDRGGTAVYVDCIMEYEEPDAGNTLFSIEGKNYYNTKGVLLNDVYIKNAANMIGSHANKNPQGWVYYKEWAYSNLNTKGLLKQGIWIEGTETVNSGVYMPDTWSKSATYDGPEDLVTKHKLHTPFPGFETEGAVSITDFESFVSGDDWGPAINKAISAAKANGSNVVIVPKGSFTTNTTITLEKETKLVGIHQLHSQISGVVKDASPFWGNETDKWKTYEEAPYILTTVDDADATCMVADVGIRQNANVGGERNWKHTGIGTINWRAGRRSTLKNVNTHCSVGNGLTTGHFLLCSSITISSILVCRW